MIRQIGDGPDFHIESVLEFKTDCKIIFLIGEIQKINRPCEGRLISTLVKKLLS